MAKTKTTKTTYWIQTIDSETPSAWMRIATRITPGAQDSGRCAWTAEVDSSRREDLDAALEADPYVLWYEEYETYRDALNAESL